MKFDIFQPREEPVNVKSFSESFCSSGRLDAEYYQVKYDDVEEAVKNYSGGYESLDYFIENYSTGYPYKSETYIESEGVPLVRINNIKKGGLDIENAINIPFYDKLLSPNDVTKENDILISMSGTIGNSCKIPKGIEAVINQRIMRITPQNIDFEVLPLIINSIIGEYQLNMIGTGGVQTNISSTDIKQILIPKLSHEVESKVSSKITKSFTLKKQSEHLLEVAKQAVEMAIEQDEESAMKWIKSQL